MKVLEHTCADSRLKCIDCAATVCPECMVVCPVGNRCDQCSGSPSKGAVRQRSVAFRPAKAVPCLFFGGVSGWMIPHIAFGGLGFCFLLVFWAAGREMGSQVRRKEFELTFSCVLPFLLGLTLGVVALALLGDLMMAVVPWLFIIVSVAFGFFLGKCGFG